MILPTGARTPNWWRCGGRENYPLDFPSWPERLVILNIFLLIRESGPCFLGQGLSRFWILDPYLVELSNISVPQFQYSSYQSPSYSFLLQIAIASDQRFHRLSWPKDFTDCPGPKISWIVLAQRFHGLSCPTVKYSLCKPPGKPVKCLVWWQY